MIYHAESSALDRAAAARGQFDDHPAAVSGVFFVVTASVQAIWAGLLHRLVYLGTEVLGILMVIETLSTERVVHSLEFSTGEKTNARQHALSQTVQPSGEGRVGADRSPGPLVGTTRLLVVEFDRLNRRWI